MKKTTRFTAMIAAMAMTMMSVGAMSASADDTFTTKSGSSTYSISATYNTGATSQNIKTATKVYKVTIGWSGSTAVVFSDATSTQDYVWDTTALKYNPVGTPSFNSNTDFWTSGGNPLTQLDTIANITNYSNDSITATMSFTLGDAELNVLPSFSDNGNISLSSAAGNINDSTTTGQATSGQITGTINLASARINQDGTLGTYTVTIS